jgi:hypothetical protein
VVSLLRLGVVSLLVACEPTDIPAVGNPGGPFRTGAGCGITDLEAGGPQNCPSHAQLGFEALADDAAFEVRTANLSRRQVSCRRSFCGTGSLSLHAEYRWRQGTVREAPENSHLGEIRYRFPEPVELYNKTITFNLFVDGAVTPVNAYLAVIERGGRFRMIDDRELFQFGRWTQRGGAVRPENMDLALPAGTTSLVATELLISVYLATDVRAGDRDHWNAEIYVDDVSW